MPVGRPRLSWTLERAQRRAQRERHRQAGQCYWQCGRKATIGTLCRVCRSRSRAIQRRLAQAKLAVGCCRQCGRPANGKQLCKRCSLQRAMRPSRQREYRIRNEPGFAARPARRGRAT